MKSINGIIYKYTNKINNKVYIGQTTRERLRKYEHKKATKDNTYFHKAVSKYGIDNFSYEILFKVIGWDKDLVRNVLNIWESYYVTLYQSNNMDYGYNLTSGGDSCYSITEYAKQRMRDGWNNQKVKEQAKISHIGNKNGMYGISAPNRKRIRCIETDEVFESIKQAAIWLNVKEFNLYNFLSKLRNPKTYNKTYHGYHWEVL